MKKKKYFRANEKTTPLLSKKKPDSSNALIVKLDISYSLDEKLD